MKRVLKHFLVASLAAVALVAMSLNLSASEPSNTGDDVKVVASFLEHVDSLSDVDAKIRDKAKSAINDFSDAPSDAVTEGLIAVYPKYSPAVESLDQDEIGKAIELLTPLSESEDKYLAADASFYLARTLMNAERFEDALPLLQQLTRELGDFTVHQGSSQYFTAVAQAGMLKNEEAIQSFMEFLQFNPDAAERLRVSAWRQVQQLQAIQEGKLSDVHHHMDFSRRKLALTETGEKTQKEQDEIVKMLATLIKEQEKKECNSSCKKGGT